MPMMQGGASQALTGFYLMDEASLRNVWSFWISLLGLLLIGAQAFALPCQNPSAAYETVREAAYENPTQAIQQARLILQVKDRALDLHGQVMCSLQLALSAYLADVDITEDLPGIRLAMQLGQNSALASELVILDVIQVHLSKDRGGNFTERLQSLERLSRSAPLAHRSYILSLILEMIQDPVEKAARVAELETLLVPTSAIGDFERVLLLEHQAFHVDRNRNPMKKIELRESFLPRLKKLGFNYWQAFIIYNHARTYEYLGTEEGFRFAAKYYAEAESRFQFLPKDGLYGSILLGKAGLLHRKGEKLAAIRLAKEAEAWFVSTRNQEWQGEVWKRLASFYLDDKRYKESLAAAEKAEGFFSAQSATDLNQIEELKARGEFGLGRKEQAVERMEKFIKDFERIDDQQLKRYVKEQGARYGLTLEEERNKVRLLQQENAKKQAAIDKEGRRSRERSMLVRTFAALLSLSGAGWLLWILRRGQLLGQTIRHLNSHMENHVLERFLPPSLVREVAAGRLHLDERPNTRLVTILAADIVSFTHGTESLGSERIAVILNRFMVSMADVIFEHKGTIDKFIGDGVLAIFGAPVDMDAETQALQASRCAQAMIKALDSLNQELLLGHTWKLRLRIGMHQGVALVGSFGTRQRSDYGAIGDAVHIASRIQAVAGPNEILLTTSVKHHLDSSLCSRRGDLKIREQSQAIPMHSLSLNAELKAA